MEQLRVLTPLDGWWQVDETNALDSPDLRLLLDLWQSRRDGGDIPRRDAFEAEDFMSFGGRLILLDVEPEPFRLRFRLVGTYVTTAVGRDVTGRYLDEVYDAEYWTRLKAHFRRVIDGRVALRMHGNMAHSNKPFVPAEGIDMPLAGEDGAVAMVLQGFDFGL